MQKNRLSVTSCALDEYGKWSDYILHVEWGSSKPYGVLSAALTQGNDDVILIDSNNQIFCIDLSQEGQANVRSITIRDINDDPKQPKSSISTKYFAVQTVGDPPVFFFQEKHSVDIVDFNFARISCLEISNARLEYHMQVFTDFVDTYCLLLNSDNKNVAFHIQNLVSSTCIRRQDSEKNLSNVARPIGNRLLDIIKWGELKFGTNPAYIGSPDLGIIGRQSTGKSYMMNRIFGTRFAVAAGRCTDGLWMNHAYINNTNFIVFDCEGLFSKKRTEDEE
ncbi:unnamed protein product, partial [Rotaria sp. Silwood1]